MWRIGYSYSASCTNIVIGNSGERLGEYFIYCWFGKWCKHHQLFVFNEWLDLYVIKSSRCVVADHDPRAYRRHFVHDLSEGD